MAEILVSNEAYALVDSATLVLAKGQRGYDPVGRVTEIGDGSRNWAALPAHSTG